MTTHPVRETCFELANKCARDRYRAGTARGEVFSREVPRSGEREQQDIIVQQLRPAVEK